MDHPQCGPHIATGSWLRDHPLTRTFLQLHIVFFISVYIDFVIYPHTTAVVLGGQLKCDCYQQVKYIYLIFHWDIDLRTISKTVLKQIYCGKYYRTLQNGIISLLIISGTHDGVGTHREYELIHVSSTIATKNGICSDYIYSNLFRQYKSFEVVS